MKRLLFVMALCVSTFAFADFAKYIEMTVNYTPTAAVDGFPVLVRLNSSRISYADVKNAGADLKFTDVSGETVYPHEVDTWNASGESLVWVRLPQLAKGAKFRMYYGDATVTTSPASAPVWQGYDLVCHVGGNANDSATPTRAGALNPNGTTKTDGVIGKTHGNAALEKGAAMINTLYADEAAGVLPNGSFSYSFWFRPVVAIEAWKLLAGPSNGADADAWSVRSYNPTEKLGVRTAKGAEVVAVTDGFAVGTWYKVDVAMDGTSLVIYVNGELKASSTTLASAAKRCWVPTMGWGGTAGHAGEFGATQSLAVDVDECRIFSTVSSAARVAADYATVKNADFLTFQAARDNLGDPGSVLMLH